MLDKEKIQKGYEESQAMSGTSGKSGNFSIRLKVCFPVFLLQNLERFVLESAIIFLYYY